MVIHHSKAMRLDVHQDENGTIDHVEVVSHAGGNVLAVAKKGGSEGQPLFSSHASELCDDDWYHKTMDQAVLDAITSACQVIDKRAEDLGL